MRSTRRRAGFAALAVSSMLVATACSADSADSTAEAATADDDGPLIVYSGRGEDLVAPLFEMFTEATGVDVEVRYAGSAEQAQLLLTEGENSPGHVFLSQEAGALGLVGDAGLLTELPDDVLGQVPEAYSADDGTWVGVTGRARVVAYDSEQVDEADVPRTAAEIADPRWSDQVGLAPGNASFLAFITAMRLVDGDDATSDWLDTLAENGVQTYDRNGDVLEAVNSGEVELGLINHYYWYAAAAEQGADNLRAQIVFGAPGDVAGLVNATGVGILSGGEGRTDALELVEFLLSDEGQTYFVEGEYEYPLVPGVPGPEGVPPLDSLNGPEIDLSDLGTVDESAALVDEAGITVG